MSIRLNSVMSMLNIGLDKISKFLLERPELGPIDNLSSNSKITDEQFEALKEKFQKDIKLKERVGEISSRFKDIAEEKKKKNKDKVLTLNVLGKVDLNNPPQETTPKVENKTLTKQVNENTATDENLVKIKLGDLDFIKHQIVYKLKGKKYVLNNKQVSAKFDKYRVDFEAIETYIQLNSRTRHFEFSNPFILNNLLKNFFIKEGERKKKLKEQKEKALQEKKEKEKEKELKKLVKKYSNAKNINDQRNQETEKRIKKIALSIPLSKIRFSGISANIIYKNKSYTNYVKKEDKELLLTLDKAQIIPIVLNPSNLSFKFSVRISEFVKKVKEHKSQPLPQPLPQQKAKLGIENIEFYDNYYLIWIINRGKKETSIIPLRVTDYNSLHCLRLIQKYFSDRFPKDIEIIYDSQKVIGLTQPYALGKYIKVLKEKVDEPGVWWEEVQNDRKPSLPACMKTPSAQIRKEISLRNCYLDYLAGMPNQKTAIKVYEVRLNQPEDVFIFTVDLKNGCYAVIFENVSFTATATWVFIVKVDSYEECIQRIFDYFTNYELHNKRQSLIKSLNPPQKFMAEEYHKIMHNEPKSWIKRLNDILIREIPSNKIQFNQGLHIPKESDSRSGSTEKENVQHLHNDLMIKLYQHLCQQYGEENVGTENHIGTKKIDVVAKVKGGYNIYEIKTDNDPRGCIREAMGQILDYAFFECTDVIHKMVIVGLTPETKDVNTYLTNFREKNSLEIYYMNV